MKNALILLLVVGLIVSSVRHAIDLYRGAHQKPAQSQTCVPEPDRLVVASPSPPATVD